MDLFIHFNAVFTFLLRMHTHIYYLSLQFFCNTTHWFLCIVKGWQTRLDLIFFYEYKLLLFIFRIYRITNLTLTCFYHSSKFRYTAISFFKIIFNIHAFVFGSNSHPFVLFQCLPYSYVISHFKKMQCSLSPLHAACMGMGMGPSTRARVVSQWLHLWRKRALPCPGASFPQLHTNRVLMNLSSIKIFVSISLEYSSMHFFIHF